ncbi:MAG: hypothetical protein ACRDKJ_07330 [Actinomycetota bacterium]
MGAGLLAAVLLLGWIPSSGAQNFGVGDPIELRGFAHGVNAHVTGIRTGETNVVDVGAATSAAVVDADADGVGGRKINEMNRSLQPEVGNKFSYARGIGLEAGLAVTPENEDQLQLAGLAEQSAPPDNDEPAVEAIAADISPLAFASLVRGQALANAQDNGLIPEVCVLGDDLSRGFGHAEDVEAIDLAPTDDLGLEAPVVALDDAKEPDNGVESKSRTRLIPTGTPNNFGLLSETRQTILPVTLLQSEAVDEDPRALTLEVAGTWFLRAIATGKAGGADVQFGSTQGEITKDNVTDLLSLLDPGGNDLLDPLPVDELEDIFGPDGLEIPGDPIINISIAQKERKLVGPNEFPDPEAPAEEAANGTKAVGAVDAIRIRLLAPTADTMLADIRLGHMEGSVQVPAGGVNCPIPVTKTADPRSIELGDSSEITITVHNDFDCDLTGVVLTDRIRQLEGDPDFKLTEASPAPKSPTIPTGNISTADVVWELGEIKKGEKKSVTMTLQAATKGGIIRDIAEATGKLANCAGEDVAGLAIAGLNLSGLSNPVDIAIPLAVTGVAGGIPTAAAGAALSAAALGLAAFLRRRRRP